jgi:hypothetical protein
LIDLLRQRDDRRYKNEKIRSDKERLRNKQRFESQADDDDEEFDENDEYNLKQDRPLTEEQKQSILSQFSSWYDSSFIVFPCFVHCILF